MNFFDCSVCGCNRPQPLSGEAGAEKYDQWAKATAAKRAHGTYTGAPKKELPRVEESKREDSPGKIKTNEKIQETNLKRSVSVGHSRDDDSHPQPEQLERPMSVAGMTSPDNNHHFKFWKSGKNLVTNAFSKSGKKMVTSMFSKSGKNLAVNAEQAEVSGDLKAANDHPHRNHHILGSPLSVLGFKKTEHHSHHGHTKSGKKMTFIGDEAVMIYTYRANPGAPFPPDPRMELTAIKGQKIDILETRSDGWVRVRKPTG